MIIVKTPHRVSLLGGSTDVLTWINPKLHRHGVVLGMSIEQYSYLTLKWLPSYFDYSYKLSYSKVETCKNTSEIEHKVIRKALEFFKIKFPIEMHYMSDVPSKSGLGSSSSFVVSLINGLNYLLWNHKFSPTDLYLKAVEFEQDYLKEEVGVQDVFWASYGGFSRTLFKSRTELEIFPFNFPSEDIVNLQKHILLFYTNIPRVSADIAAKYYPKLADRETELWNLVELANQGAELIKRKDYMGVGKLMGESWQIKKSGHPDISSPTIDRVIEQIEAQGAYAKVSGAGQGSIICICEPNKRHIIQEICKNFTEITVNIAQEGSSIIYAN